MSLKEGLTSSSEIRLRLFYCSEKSLCPRDFIITFLINFAAVLWVLQFRIMEFKAFFHNRRAWFTLGCIFGKVFSTCMIINDCVNVTVSSPALELKALVTIEPRIIPSGYYFCLVLSIFLSFVWIGSNLSFVLMYALNGDLNLYLRSISFFVFSETVTCTAIGVSLNSI